MKSIIFIICAAAFMLSSINCLPPVQSMDTDELFVDAYMNGYDFCRKLYASPNADDIEIKLDGKIRKICKFARDHNYNMLNAYKEAIDNYDFELLKEMFEFFVSNSLSYQSGILIFQHVCDKAYSETIQPAQMSTYKQLVTSILLKYPEFITQYWYFSYRFLKIVALNEGTNAVRKLFLKQSNALSPKLFVEVGMHYCNKEWIKTMIHFDLLNGQKISQSYDGDLFVYDALKVVVKYGNCVEVFDFLRKIRPENLRNADLTGFDELISILQIETPILSYKFFYRSPQRVEVIAMLAVAYKNNYVFRQMEHYIADYLFPIFIKAAIKFGNIEVVNHFRKLNMIDVNNYELLGLAENSGHHEVSNLPLGDYWRHLTTETN